MKAKPIAIAAAMALWLGAGAWASRYVAGGAYLALHKTDPRTVQATTWSEYWADYQDDRQERKKLQGSMGLAIGLLFGAPIAAMLANTGRGRSLHGDARWATRREIEDAKLLGARGIILGKFAGKYLLMDEPKFVLLCAPARSGKGVGTIIPNLLHWPDSTLVVDIKGENFDVTSGFRARHGQKVFKFAPFDEKFETHRWNPLTYVSRDPRFVVGDLQGKGYMLYPKGEGTEGFFNDQARNLFVGLALYCIESRIPLTIGEVLRRSNGGGQPKEFWQAVVKDGVTAGGKTRLSEDCLNALRQFAGNSDNTLTSILSTFNAPLGVFANPLVDAATSADDFDLREVRRQRMSIYVCIPANKLDEAALLVNLFFSIAIDENTKVLPETDRSLKHKCLLILDEFPALGRVDKYVKSIGYIAGYGLRVLSIAQSLSQLQDRRLYGEEGARTLVTNHLMKLVYAPQEQKDAQEYSEILGYMTEKGVSRGRSHGKGSVTRSENVSDQRRALMLPQELREMGMERVIVLCDTCKPIFADKIFYYKDPVFVDRLKTISPTLRALGEKLPTKDELDDVAFVRKELAVPVPAIDLDGYLARREGRVRELTVDESVDASRLALNYASMPQASSKATPIAAEVSAMANWLFDNIKWTGEGENSANGERRGGSGTESGLSLAAA